MTLSRARDSRNSQTAIDITTSRLYRPYTGQKWADKNSVLHYQSRTHARPPAPGEMLQLGWSKTSMCFSTECRRPDLTVAPVADTESRNCCRLVLFLLQRMSSLVGSSRPIESYIGTDTPTSAIVQSRSPTLDHITLYCVDLLSLLNSPSQGMCKFNEVADLK